MSRTWMLGTAAMVLVAGTFGTLATCRVRDDRYIAGIWQTLEQVPTDERVFSEAMVADLPAPAQRYFLHAIQPGTPLATRLHWHYHGEMKPGADLPWMSLEAEQILVRERGFVWKATATWGPVLVKVTDHYLDGQGRMRIAFFGLVPVISTSDEDLARSAMARLIIEGVALPSALLPGPNVTIEGIDDARFTVTTRLHGETTPVTLTVDAEGRLTEVTMERWGNVTDDGSYQPIPYGMTIEDVATFDGYTIPIAFAGGWWYGTEKYLEVVRLNVDRATLE